MQVNNCFAKLLRKPSGPAGTNAAVPEWMQAAGWQKSSGSREETPSDALGPEPGSESIAQAEIPAWLKSMAPAGVADLDNIDNDAEEYLLPRRKRYPRLVEINGSRRSGT